MNKVELTDEEVKIFRDIQKYYAILHILNKNNVFGLTSATLTLHFDGQGKIVKIDKTEYLRA